MSFVAQTDLTLYSYIYCMAAALAVLLFFSTPPSVCRLRRVFSGKYTSGSAGDGGKCFILHHYGRSETAVDY